MLREYRVTPLLELSRFDAAPLIAFIAAKETDYGTTNSAKMRCGLR